jgi:hypothetical protein
MREIKYGQVWAYYGEVLCMALAPDMRPRLKSGEWRVMLLAIGPGRPYTPEPGQDRLITYNLGDQPGWEEVE